jgi:phosphoglycolate phosphatase
VGDSGMDMRTARAAAIPIIAVDFGYSEVPIATLSPDQLIGSFIELPAAIAEIEYRRRVKTQRVHPAAIAPGEA